MRYVEKIRKELNELAQNLVRTDTEKNARLAMGSIFATLQKFCRQEQESRFVNNPDFYSIDRIRLVGSAGKNTDIKHFSNYDVAIFANNAWPYEFAQIISDFGNILQRNYVYKDFYILYRYCTDRALKLTIRFYDEDEEDMKFDILPARNFLWKESLKGISIPLTQGKRVLDYFKEEGYNCTDIKDFSSSLSELQVHFVKSESQIAIDTVRLAKFWNEAMNIYNPETNELAYIPGRSTLIETIAIYAAREVEKAEVGNPKNHLLRAFKKFLTLMSNFSELDIAMTDSLDKIGYGQLSQKMVKQSPLVLDPGNIHNNLAHRSNIKDFAVQLFEEYAGNSKNKLLSYFNPKGKTELWEVFAVQPNGGLTNNMRDILFG